MNYSAGKMASWEIRTYNAPKIDVKAQSLAIRENYQEKPIIKTSINKITFLFVPCSVQAC